MSMSGRLGRFAFGLSLIMAGTFASATAIRPAAASTFVVPGFDELVAMSSAVIDGVVVSRESRVAANGRIVTDYAVVVSDVFTGAIDPAADSTVTFTFPGGTFGDVGELVTGVPTFAPGDEVVLFLKRPAPDAATARPGFHLVTGMAVGALKIERATDGTATVHGLAARAFCRNRAATAVIAPDRVPDFAALTEFVDGVRNAAAKRGPK